MEISDLALDLHNVQLVTTEITDFPNFSLLEIRVVNADNVSVTLKLYCPQGQVPEFVNLPTKTSSP